MINEKETLKNWHQTNPSLTIDDLLGLLDGIVTVPNLTTYPYNPTTITYKDSNVPYSVPTTTPYKDTNIPPYTVTCSK